MKQFVFGLAVVAVALSSIPARAASSTVFPSVASGVGASVFFVDTNSISGDTVFVFVGVTPAAHGALLNYSINDSNGTVNDSGFGPIPTSDFTVSGSSVNSGKAIITLNVNTCDLPTSGPAAFMTFNGTCGPFNFTWTEEAVSVGGFFKMRGDTQFTFLLQDGSTGILVINGNSVNFGALATGTAKGFGPAVPQFGNVSQQTNVNVVFTSGGRLN